MTYEKNFWEKVGDQLAHPGRRFLFGLLSILILGPFGAFIALSFRERKKTYYVSSITVQTSTGETVPCAIMKQRRYAYMPLVPIVSLFFYVPYKVDYFLLKNVSATTLPSGARVNGTVLNIELIRTEQLTKSKAQAVQREPQLLAQELSGQSAQARNEFLQAAKPFFDTQLMQEIFATDHLSLCQLTGLNVLFYYSKVSGHFIGFRVSDVDAQRITQDPSFMLAALLATDSDTLVERFVILDDSVLERLLRARKEDPELRTEDEKTSEVLSGLEQNKKLLTKELIEQTLTQKTSSTKKVTGFLLFIPSLAATELGIGCFATGLFVLGLIFLPAAGWLCYWAIRRIQQGKRNRENIQCGRYRIVPATCVSVTEKLPSDAEDVTMYTTQFSNGESQTLNCSLGVEGDPFYLVYLPGSKHADAIFNGIDYLLAPDLSLAEGDVKNGL